MSPRCFGVPTPASEGKPCRGLGPHTPLLWAEVKCDPPSHTCLDKQLKQQHSKCCLEWKCVSHNLEVKSWGSSNGHKTSPKSEPEIA